MQFDFKEMLADDRYKVLTGTVVPRPIAWITSISTDGVRNAAPFSFFNAVGKDPPLVAVGILGNSDGSLKDTARNIIETEEFVVNLVSEPLARDMNFTSMEAAADVDELTLAKVETRPSIKVRPPLIAASPVSFECRLHTPLQFASGQVVVIGEVVWAHVRDEFVADPNTAYIDSSGLGVIARMGGRGQYLRTTDTFHMSRPTVPAPTSAADVTKP